MRYMTLVILLVGLVFAVPKTGSPAPDFQLPDLDGTKTYSLEDFRGKVILLNFWASWCTGCKAEMPEFIKLQEDYKDRGFLIVAVNVDRNPEKAKKFLRGLEEITGRKINFLVLYDGKKRVIKKYRPVGMPSSYLIDRNGVLVKYFPSSFTEENIGVLKKALEEVLR